jgi:hypothetical protein
MGAVSACLVATPCAGVWGGVETGNTLPMGNACRARRDPASPTTANVYGRAVVMTKVISLPPEGLLTVPELADRLRVSRNYVYRHARGDDGYDKWPSIAVPYNGRTRYLFAPEHVAIILASMQPGDVITMRRPRQRTAPAAPARKRRSS